MQMEKPRGQPRKDAIGWHALPVPLPISLPNYAQLPQSTPPQPSPPQPSPPSLSQPSQWMGAFERERLEWGCKSMKRDVYGHTPEKLQKRLAELDERQRTNEEARAKARELDPPRWRAYSTAGVRAWHDAQDIWFGTLNELRRAARETYYYTGGGPFGPFDGGCHTLPSQLPAAGAERTRAWKNALKAHARLCMDDSQLAKEVKRVTENNRREGRGNKREREAYKAKHGSRYDYSRRRGTGGGE